MRLGFKIVLAKGTDALWRFDRETVERVPAMNRLALARFRSTQAERTGMRDDLSDPSLTCTTHWLASSAACGRRRRSSGGIRRASK